MRPIKLVALMKSGTAEKHSAGDIFYSLDFEEMFYSVASGYVKRYSLSDGNKRVIESIYGPNYFFPLTPVFKKLLDLNISQDTNTYIYQAMTDVEIRGISGDALVSAVQKDPELYGDLLFESGIRLRANINRLASNALKDDYRKITHQLAYLAEEFGELDNSDANNTFKIAVPLEAIDIAEQLNIAVKTVLQAFELLSSHETILIKDNHVHILDMSLLRDAYL